MEAPLHNLYIAAYRTLTALLLFLTPFASAVLAEELKVISQSNIAGPLEKLLPIFEKARGVRVSVAWENPGVTLTRLRNNEPSDVVIVTTTIFDTVVKEGFFIKDSAYPFVRGRIGVGVSPTDPQPNIPNKEAFREFMLKANSIGMVDPNVEEVCIPAHIAICSM